MRPKSLSSASSALCSSACDDMVTGAVLTASAVCDGSKKSGWRTIQSSTGVQNSEVGRKKMRGRAKVAEGMVKRRDKSCTKKSDTDTVMRSLLAQHSTRILRLFLTKTVSFYGATVDIWLPALPMVSQSRGRGCQRPCVWSLDVHISLMHRNILDSGAGLFAMRCWTPR